MYYNFTVIILLLLYTLYTYYSIKNIDITVYKMRIGHWLMIDVEHIAIAKMVVCR